MTRNVVDNRQVAHLWANQSQPSARSHNGNFWFEGDTLYSYSTPIARLVDGVALFSSHRYSVTTSGKHMGPAYRATGYQGFTVPNLGVNAGKHRDEPGDMHANNAKHLEAAFVETVASYKRSRDFDGDRAFDHLEQLAKECRRYCERFDVNDARRCNVVAAWSEIVEHRAKRDTPQARAKREREQAKRKERELEVIRIARADLEERADAWRKGLINTNTLRAPRDYPIMFRLRMRNIVETSWGASVPLAEALRLYRLLKAFVAEGHKHSAEKFASIAFRVGGFVASRMWANGDFQAGCHFVTFTEVERFAKAIDADKLAALQAA